ncbi:hypothetical protein CC2G_010974 [Coprinopsis cinerea AmutBmut pab1-1]|nr:hypothetical protein CC2G_010974 [Coprinopsis cinerea AmutBmut pab1-1]
MNSLQHDKKTSINSLLNPEASIYPPAHYPTVSTNSVPPHGHQVLNYTGAQYTNTPSTYGLRAANWGLEEASRRKEAEQVQAGHHRRSSHSSDIVPPGHMGTNSHDSRMVRPQIDRAPARLETVPQQSQQWQGSPEPMGGISYDAPHTGRAYPENRGALQDGFQTQNMSSYKPTDYSVSAWQTSERVSVRLAARELMPAPQPTGGHSQPLHQSHHGSHPPYPPTGGAQSQQEKPSSKRQLPENEADAAAPKAKRPAKSKPKSGSDGVPVPSKRGFNSKKRSEAAQIASQDASTVSAHALALPTFALERGQQRTADTRFYLTPAVKLFPELQFARCMSNRYKNQDFPRCVSCTRRWAGDTSLGIKLKLPALHFPEQWNVPIRKDHISRCKRVIANALLPTLKQEREHINATDLIRRTRESEVRVTCDTCMTSIFSSSWMCRLCGREACSDCFALVRELTEDRPGADPAEIAEMRRRREKYAHSNPFFLCCTRRNEHDAQHFSPMSRFWLQELQEAINEMEQLLLRENAPIPISSISSGLAPAGPAPTAASLKVDSDPTSGAPTAALVTEPVNEDRPWTEVYLANQKKASFLSAQLAPTGAAGPQYIPPNLTQATAMVPTLEPYRFTDQEVTGVDSASKFAKIWEHGEPLVVSNILNKFKLEWTPEYFIREFGDRECLITECEQDVNKRTTIKEFFSSFGNYASRTEVWKLKDWPPSADFKTAFPKLYEDFANAVPVPDYVRRDGVYNIGSHFPANVIAPDLGPKMYNAYAANQRPGGKGSTRLHMDMADAMNVMLFASNCPDGTPGCAVWDIYRACDSDKIRTFLRTTHTLPPNYDPIHGQQYYLDDDLRLRLFKEYGVKSYRIYQRPGEAIFIPAGCAHQVSNLADSIKIAIDYVSPENIDRCAQLTREFREQNKSKVWKEDVLQLKSMMWFAWQSCRRREMKLNGSRATPSSSSTSSNTLSDVTSQHSI